MSRLPHLGCVDQWVDSTEALGRLTELRAAVRAGLKLDSAPSRR